MLWHRAMLRYVEELINFSIPYWNGYAANTGDPTSPDAGIPAVFLEETYEHPTKGTRPNPLKYALTLDGFNKITTSKYATRNQVLIDGPTSPGWNAQITYFSKYHQQLLSAISQQSFSHPEGDAIPWANIPIFLQDMPDDMYMYRTTFDGLFEQAHDNYHGWVGGLTGDMADNIYTAFDPIFYSYHANIDRIAASFMRSHPEQQYSSNFPLQPFVDSAKGLNYTDPRVYLYTTIGDMAKDIMALNYLYAPPSSPDYQPLPKLQRHSLIPKGGNVTHVISKDDIQSLISAQTATKHEYKTREPWIFFPNIKCTTESYTIDIFPATASSTAADHTSNPDYIGRLTRLGMGSGPEKGGLINKQRCHKPAVSRAVPAADHKAELEKSGWKVRSVVRRLKTGEEIGEEEKKEIGGFEGSVVWKV